MQYFIKKSLQNLSKNLINLKNLICCRGIYLVNYDKTEKGIRIVKIKNQIHLIRKQVKKHFNSNMKID